MQQFGDRIQFNLYLVVKKLVYNNKTPTQNVKYRECKRKHFIHAQLNNFFFLKMKNEMTQPEIFQVQCSV